MPAESSINKTVCQDGAMNETESKQLVPKPTKTESVTRKIVLDSEGYLSQNEEFSEGTPWKKRDVEDSPATLLTFPSHRSHESVNVTTTIQSSDAGSKKKTSEKNSEVAVTLSDARKRAYDSQEYLSPSEKYSEGTPSKKRDTKGSTPTLTNSHQVSDIGSDREMQCVVGSGNDEDESMPFFDDDQINSEDFQYEGGTMIIETNGESVTAPPNVSVVEIKPEWPTQLQPLIPVLEDVDKQTSSPSELLSTSSSQKLRQPETPLPPTGTNSNNRIRNEPNRDNTFQDLGNSSFGQETMNFPTDEVEYGGPGPTYWQRSS